MKQVGIGIIGFGSVASWGHFPGYLEIPDKARVVAICDTHLNAMSQAVSKTGAKTFTEYEELLADPAVDVVDICLPHFLHGKVALAAAKAGKHVLVEKPFTMSLEEADAVISAATDNRVKLMVAENTRFVNAYQVAKSLVSQGALGDICFVRTYIGGQGKASLEGPANWRTIIAQSGGGALFDGAVHSFYLIEWMVGKITSIMSHSTQFIQSRTSEVDDNSSGIFKLENGGTGNYSVTFTSEIPWTERLEVFGLNGSVVVDMLSERPVQLFSTNSEGPKTELVLDLGTGERSYTQSSWKEPVFPHSATNWKSDSMKKEVKHFVSCILENEEPWVSGRAGKRAVEIALKAYESEKMGKETAV